MVQVNDDYSLLAADSRAVAAQQVLENVRQKHLTAAASWDRLADGHKKMQMLRLKRLADAVALSRPARTAATGISEENRDER